MADNLSSGLRLRARSSGLIEAVFAGGESGIGHPIKAYRWVKLREGDGQVGYAAFHPEHATTGLVSHTRILAISCPAR